MKCLETLPTRKEDLAEGTPNPELIIALNRQMNAQAERIKALLSQIGQNTEIEEIEDEDELILDVA